MVSGLQLPRSSWNPRECLIRAFPERQRVAMCILHIALNALSCYLIASSARSVELEAIALPLWLAGGFY